MYVADQDSDVKYIYVCVAGETLALNWLLYGPNVTLPEGFCAVIGCN